MQWGRLATGQGAAPVLALVGKAEGVASRARRRWRAVSRPVAARSEGVTEPAPVVVAPPARPGVVAVAIARVLIALDFMLPGGGRRR